MRAHSMGGVKFHCTAENGQEPVPFKVEMGGVGGGGNDMQVVGWGSIF